MDNSITSILDTPEKERQCAQDVQGMRSHPGWHWIERMLNENIKILEEQILSDDELTMEAERELKQDRLRWIFFRDLPKILVNDQVPSSTDGGVVMLDPYEPEKQNS